jgi:hypothetical protein
MKVVIKKPEALVKKDKEKDNIDSLWPEVCSFVIENPKCTDTELYRLFGERSNYTSLTKFKDALHNRKLYMIRSSVNKGRGVKRADSLQLTEEYVQTFEKERRRKGMVHLGKMDSIVNGVQTMLEKESKKLSDMEDAGPLLSYHVDNAAKVHKLAKDVYRIDAESDANASKQNIAILMQFDPGANQQQVIEI